MSSLVEFDSNLIGGNVVLTIEKRTHLYDHFGSDIEVSLLLGKREEGTTVFKKCLVTGKPRSPKYKKPFTSYDFQALAISKAFDLLLEVNSENLITLSGKIPTANMHNPVVTCFFENSPNFVNDEASLEDQEEMNKAHLLVDDVVDESIRIISSFESRIPYEKFSFSPVDGETPLALEVTGLTNVMSSFSSITYNGLVSFIGFENRIKTNGIAQCQLKKQKASSASTLTSHKINLPYAIDYANRTTSLDLMSILINPNLYNKLNVECPELIPVSHQPDNHLVAYLNFIYYAREGFYPKLLDAPTFSPAAQAPNVRPKPPKMPITESLAYYSDLAPGLSAIKMNFVFTKALENTVWDNTEIDIILGEYSRGAVPNGESSCRLKALTQEDITPSSIETLQKATYYKTFVLNYSLDAVTKLIHLKGTMPTFGMKDPKITCYVTNDAAFASTWKMENYRPLNKVSVGDAKIPGDGISNPLVHGSTSIPPIENLNIQFVKDDPVSISFFKPATIGVSQYSFELPELVTFKELGTAMERLNFKGNCDLTLKPEDGEVVNVSVESSLTLNVLKGSYLAIVYQYPNEPTDVHIVCKKLTPISHYYHDSFYVSQPQLISETMSYLTSYALVEFPTQTTPPEKDDPVRPEPEDDDDDDDDDEDHEDGDGDGTTASALALQLSFTVVIGFMSAVVFMMM